MYHGPDPSIGWTGNWGMAASAEEKDYVHQFISMLDSVQGSQPQHTIANVAGFELRFNTEDPNQYFAFTDTLNPDLIVVEIGDIVNTDTAVKYDFGNHYYTMLQTLKSKHPLADIVAMTKFWVNRTIDTMIINAAQKAIIKVADLSLIPWDNSNYAYSERHFDYSGVGIHPGDRGMRRIAEIILAAVLDGTTFVPHNLTIQFKSKLIQNYPNPFNSTTNISFSIPARTFVSLLVFDMLGREVATLVNEELSSGNHTRQWNATNMTSGIYFYRLSAVPSAWRDLVPTAGREGQAGTFTETKKLVLLR
jgi:hypothetical protein